MQHPTSMPKPNMTRPRIGAEPESGGVVRGPSVVDRAIEQLKREQEAEAQRIAKEHEQKLAEEAKQKARRPGRGMGMIPRGVGVMPKRKEGTAKPAVVHRSGSPPRR